MNFRAKTGQRERETLMFWVTYKSEHPSCHVHIITYTRHTQTHTHNFWVSYFTPWVTLGAFAVASEACTSLVRWHNAESLQHTFLDSVSVFLSAQVTNTLARSTGNTSRLILKILYDSGVVQLNFQASCTYAEEQSSIQREASKEKAAEQSRALIEHTTTATLFTGLKWPNLFTLEKGPHRSHWFLHTVHLIIGIKLGVLKCD